MILITGAQKSFALYKTIEEGVNHMWTASALQQHANALLICDDDATLELRVKTVKYFKVCVMNSHYMNSQSKIMYIFSHSPLSFFSSAGFDGISFKTNLRCRLIELLIF